MKYKGKLADIVCTAHLMSIQGQLVFWDNKPHGYHPGSQSVVFMLPLGKKEQRHIYFDPNQMVEVNDGELTFTDVQGAEHVMMVYETVALTPDRIRETCGGDIYVISN